MLDAIKLQTAIRSVAEKRAKSNPRGFVADDVHREANTIAFTALAATIDALLTFGDDHGATVALARIAGHIDANPRDLVSGMNGAATPVSPIAIDTPRRRKTDPRDSENYTGAEGWTDTDKAGSLA